MKTAAIFRGMKCSRTTNTFQPASPIQLLRDDLGAYIDSA